MRYNYVFFLIPADFTKQHKTFIVSCSMLEEYKNLCVALRKEKKPKMKTGNDSLSELTMIKLSFVSQLSEPLRVITTIGSINSPNRPVCPGAHLDEISISFRYIPNCFIDLLTVESSPYTE